MRVLIIPEDPTLDQHVLKPVVERILDDLGKRARVDVLQDPHISGAAQALDPQVAAEIVQDHRMVDLFVLVVDRDCDRAGNVGKARARVSEHPEQPVAVLAQEEVEVWALALFRDELRVPWSAVRAECDPKELFWAPFVERKGWLGTVGRGRKRAMRGLGGGWAGLLAVCPEIVDLRGC